jgi:hypothetical protein
LDDVKNINGKVMNGNTIESTTCDATRSVSIPERPTAMATTIEGMIAKILVKNRRTTG